MADKDIGVKLPGQTAEWFTADEFAQKPSGEISQLLDFIVGGTRRRHRDIILTAAGTAQTAGQKLKLFNTGDGEAGVVWNTQAAFTKGKFHTTMETQGKFPFGVTAVVIAFEIMHQGKPAKAATVGSGSSLGMTTDSADNATQPTGYNALAFTQAMLFQNWWHFQRGSKTIEEADYFIGLPQTQAFNGVAGATNFNLVQNTAILPEVTLLKQPKVIRKSEDFQVVCEALSALAQPVDFVAWFVMDVIEVGDGSRNI